ncbi:PIN domain-containing protein [Candidatus Woesearchaeota archaeon]|nr:PIN domain-containing protein [Candidatus Woesearchaeota archaeon]
MGLNRYFFDTYALFSLVEGRNSYAGYGDKPVFLTVFNLSELYFLVLRDFGESKAKKVYYQFKCCVVELADEILFEALKFRLNNMKKKLSYADCIGYAYAKKNNMIFLTGDEQFSGLDAVELVK